MANFNFVQGNFAGPVTTIAFTSNNTKNNCIFCVVYFANSVPATFGPTSIITDSQGNSYYAIQTGPPGSFQPPVLFAAINIKAGPNTITWSGGGSANIYIAEYSSALTYYICPGSVPTTSTTFDNRDTNYRGGSGPVFTSASEVMAILVGNATLSGSSTWTASRPSTVFRFNGNTYVCFAEDDLPNLSTYSNNVDNGTGSGFRISAFVNLNKTTCSSSLGPGTGTGGGGGGGSSGNIFV